MAPPTYFLCASCGRRIEATFGEGLCAECEEKIMAADTAWSVKGNDDEEVRNAK
jgi:DNA-directed RNA polymerase subunit RPC12/RpoP